MQIRPALIAGDRKAAERASLDVRMRRRERAGRELRGAAKQRLQRVTAALVDEVSSFGRCSRSFSTSAWICGVVPNGGVATLNLSGLALASATNSLMVFAGVSERTTNVLGEDASSQTPTKSLWGS